MTNQEGLIKLKELSSQLYKVDYEEIIQLLKTTIKKILIPLAKLRANSLIDRARKNDGEALFDKVEKLSYIKDQYVIDNYLTEQINHTNLCFMEQLKPH